MTSLICLLNLEILIIVRPPYTTLNNLDGRHSYVFFFFVFFFLYRSKRRSQAFITHSSQTILFSDSEICDTLEKFVSVVKILLLLSSSFIVWRFARQFRSVASTETTRRLCGHYPVTRPRIAVVTRFKSLSQVDTLLSLLLSSSRYYYYYYYYR